jgi:3-polyprenyl-4-hydroxybenzoate decarboxylase
MPKTVGDLVDFVVSKVLDLLGIEHDLLGRWTGRREARESNPHEP